ncbi:MAG: epoxyqueuosine reductase QueH [Bacilli bacterium]|jgi:hypothetical protein
MDRKNNYYQESLAEIEELKKAGKKPSLLLHVCCGPCSCFPLTFLCPYFDVTILYNNSNIYPEEEYNRRLDSLKTLLREMNRDYGFLIPLIVAPYDHENYIKSLTPYKDEKEGQKRCEICYAKRIESAFEYAMHNGFEYVSTVMTVSSHKNSLVINEIGRELESRYPNVRYFYSDFKKNNGELIGRQLSDRYGLYMQNYCGCEFSLYDLKKRFFLLINT